MEDKDEYEDFYYLRRLELEATICLLWDERHKDQHTQEKYCECPRDWKPGYFIAVYICLFPLF